MKYLEEYLSPNPNDSQSHILILDGFFHVDSTKWQIASGININILVKAFDSEFSVIFFFHLQSLRQNVSYTHKKVSACAIVQGSSPSTSLPASS